MKRIFFFYKWIVEELTELAWMWGFKGSIHHEFCREASIVGWSLNTQMTRSKRKKVLVLFDIARKYWNDVFSFLNFLNSRKKTI